MNINLQSLVKDTLFAPDVAASRLVTFKIPTNILWGALFLIAILNAIVISVSLHIFPPLNPEAMFLRQVFQTPVFLAVFLAGGLVVTVLSLYWAGHALGGKARFDELLIVFSWLQYVQFAGQITILLCAFISPQIADLLNLVAGFWGLYVLIGFIAAVHQFSSSLRAVGVMALSVGAMAFGLFILILLFGAGL